MPLNPGKDEVGGTLNVIKFCGLGSFKEDIHTEVILGLCLKKQLKLVIILPQGLFLFIRHSTDYM